MPIDQSCDYRSGVSELKSGAMYQQGRGRGSSVRVAFAAAGRNLFKQPKLKAKRFTMFTATVSIGTVPDTAKETHGGANEDQAEGHFPQSKS